MKVLTGITYTLEQGVLTFRASESGKRIDVEVGSEFELTEEAANSCLLRALGDSSSLRETALSEGIASSEEDAIDEEPGKSRFFLDTANYPFVDMAAGADGYAIDTETMSRYLGAETPPPACLELPGDRIRLMHPRDCGIDVLRWNSQAQFAFLIGSAFALTGSTGTYKDPTNGYIQQDLAVKCVPSGGSRHPAELFLKISKSPSIPEGLYHYSTRDSCLVSIGRDWGSSCEILEPRDEDNGETWNVEFIIGMMTSRAWYRYREARSARALFVDAGHVVSQMECSAAYVNWSVDFVMNIDTKFGQTTDKLPQELIGLATGRMRTWSTQ